ncbi:putative nuclear protein [Diplodia seriata]|uniref:Putative nuclear protein n=1 Tax=Diplodia seriata TaxID=420778 RepID=A0A0G2EN53_9PEZI|nr:putative nuclear protein [Diplodia seriata]
MRQRNHGGPKLPRDLLDQIGASGAFQGNGRARGRVLGRKDRRKAEREQKKSHRPQPRKFQQRSAPQDDFESDDEDDDIDEDAFSPPPAKSEKSKVDEKPLKSALMRADAPAKSTAKKTAGKDKEAKEKVKEPKKKEKRKRTPSPSPPPAVPKKTQARLDEDDAEIAALEKKLGMKGKKKLPKGFDEDGLADLLDGLDDELDFAVTGLTAEESFSEDDSEEGEEGWEDDDEGLEESDGEEEVDGAGDGFAGFSEDESAEGSEDDLDGLEEDDFDEEDSEQEVEQPKDIERLYENNPRQYVTTTLIDLLLGLACDPSSLQDTFLILHAGFIAAVYKVVGTDFGAQLVERFAAEFDKYYGSYNDDSSGKETTNLISLLAQMYNFQVVGCNLVFDYIRIFLEELKEVNTELLLRIVRMSGPQLRQDDPTALKDIVVLLQKSVANAGEANLSVRTKFMIETIQSLKNNRMKTGVAASAITSEHTTRMKKTLGSLNSRSIKASEPLRIGLKDLRDTEKKGKWWLVGASWRNDTADDPAAHEKASKTKKSKEAPAEEIILSGTTDLLQLAKEQRMNTDIRRSIFISIMSASDFKDAHLRLMKLRLKKAQELEIPRVLIRCAGAEQSYNPYYTLIARRLCSEKPLKKAFQFSLWDLFKRMGEKDEMDDADYDEDEGKEALTTRSIVNLAKMFGTLIAEGGLSIAVLKTLNFGYLQPKTEAFVEVLLSTVILRSQKKTADQRNEEALLDVVMMAKDAPQIARGLQYFFKKVVRKAEAAGSKAERETVRWGASVAADGLTVLATQRVAVE